MEVVTPIHPAQSHWFGECHSTVVMTSPDPLVPGKHTKAFSEGCELRFAMEGLLQARSRSCRREKLSPFEHGVRAAISVMGAGEGCYNEYCRDNGGILLLPSLSLFKTPSTIFVCNKPSCRKSTSPLHAPIRARGFLKF